MKRKFRRRTLERFHEIAALLRDETYMAWLQGERRKRGLFINARDEARFLGSVRAQLEFQRLIARGRAHG